MMRKRLMFVMFAFALAACSSPTGETTTDVGTAMEDDGVMSRHQTPVPGEYAGVTNPIPADSASLERGAQLYTATCASCHGDDGRGDGPAAAALDPAPAPLAHSSQMLADDYLFWRISEGGVPFGTTMPAWKTLDEQSRWDLINYIRSLDPNAIEE